MPVYQYACRECGEQLEVRQSFTDDPLTECPACSGRLRKVLTAVGVVFKGSGFYRTDSRAAANGGSAKQDSANDGGTSPASGGSSSETGGSSSSDGAGSTGSPAAKANRSSGPGSTGSAGGETPAPKKGKHSAVAG